MTTQPSTQASGARSRWRRFGVAAVSLAFLAIAGCGGGGTTSSGYSTRPGATTTAAPTSGTPAPSMSSPTTSQSSDTPSDTRSSSTASDKLDYASNPDLLRAAATAEKKVPHSTLVSIESEDGESRWEAQVVTSDGTEHEMDLSRHGTRVLSGPQVDDDDHDRAKHRQRVRASKLTYRDAALVVADTVTDGRITELNLDDYRGKTVWEADVLSGAGPKHALKIDARTGEVLVDKSDPG